MKRRALAKRTTSPTMLDIAWAAGIWEGEGSCHFNQLVVSQKDPWILERFVQLFGGRIYRTNNGASYIHTWYLRGAHARGFMYTIFSFLSSRRRAQLIKNALGVREDRSVFEQMYGRS